LVSISNGCGPKIAISNAIGIEERNENIDIYNLSLGDDYDTSNVTIDLELPSYRSAAILDLLFNGKGEIAGEIRKSFNDDRLRYGILKEYNQTHNKTSTKLFHIDYDFDDVFSQYMGQIKTVFHKTFKSMQQERELKGYKRKMTPDEFLTDMFRPGDALMFTFSFEIDDFVHRHAYCFKMLADVKKNREKGVLEKADVTFSVKDDTIIQIKDGNIYLNIDNQNEFINGNWHDDSTYVAWDKGFYVLQFNQSDKNVNVWFDETLKESDRLKFMPEDLIAKVISSRPLGTVSYDVNDLAPQ